MACILRPGFRQWANQTLPFTINNAGFTTGAITNINAAIAQWNNNTNWQIVARNNQADFVTFRVGTVCSSPIGRQGGRQFINLANNCGFGASVHEIGHAIGFAHEQSRRDRNRRVVVMPDRIRSDRLSNFRQVSAQQYQDHGTYDYGSIMHYGRAAFLRTQRYDWSSGWSSAEFFTVSGQTFIFLLKVQTGEVHIHQVDAQIGVSHEVQRYDWSSGWTNVRFFQAGNNVYLFLLKRGNGTVHIHRMNQDGTVGPRTDTRDWSGGWTTTEFWRQGNLTFMFLLKSGTGMFQQKTGTGRVHIHQMQNNGRVGARVATYNWTRGWTAARLYQVGGQMFLFLLKSGNGVVHIHRINANGTVGARVEDHDWSSGWTNVELFNAGANTYLFLLKQNGGIVHVHRMNGNGTVGTRTDTRDWSDGWTSSEFYQIGNTIYFFLLKFSSGVVHLHRVQANGLIGNELLLTPPITIYARQAIGQRGGLSAGDIAAANTR